MKRERYSLVLGFLTFILILAFATHLVALPISSKSIVTKAEAEPYGLMPFTVILDAGHGGEDGGAVSASGIYEKDLNLALAKRLQELLEANGVTVVMTRETDILLYDRNVNYQGRKKALDLAARRKIAEANPNAIFVSIHMNSYPLSQYSGLQVWYSSNHPQSQAIAEQIQSTVTSLMQPENDRSVKAGTASIYLLHHLTSPAVLIECGFLSNAEEAALLNTSAYQSRLAFSIFLSIMQSQNSLSRT